MSTRKPSSKRRAKGKTAARAVETADRRDPEGIQRFITQFSAELIESGMPPMPARVWAALLASENGRLTAAELAETLHVSPAAVSAAVRYLIQARMLSRERELGSRRDHFVMPSDFWYEVVLGRFAILDHWVKSLEIGIEAVGPDTVAGERLRETVDFLDFLRTELPTVLERWHEYRNSTDKHRPARR